MIFARYAVAILLVFGGILVSPSPIAASMQQGGSIAALTSTAVASLRSEYDVLISGLPPGAPLVPQVDELTRSLTSAERLKAVLERRARNADYNVHFTQADIALEGVALEVGPSELRLLATERSSLGVRTAQSPRDAAGDRTLSLTRHAFVFANEQGRWTLVRDELPAFELNRNSDPIPVPDRTAQVQRPGAAQHVGGLGHFVRPLAAGYYNRTAAQSYIQQYAINANPAYRFFYDVGGDCTNFVSQVMRAGGWVNRPGFYLDWNNWWYDSIGGQTRSWTYTHAFQQFFNTSGRGQFLSYLSDLSVGDVIQVDFGANGTIDHSVVIDTKINSTPSGIWISYHSTGPDNRYHRSLADFLGAWPVGPNNYWAEHVIGTEP